MFSIASLLTALTLVLHLSPKAHADVTLPDIDVTGLAGPLEEIGSAVTELKGARLDQKRRATIGETLRGETGVTSTDYGPNASRPIIRGLGGDRIRVLQNGVGVFDASGASDDHAVAVEPLAVEKIEIVRGPSALLYGSQAVGGVVNMITTRVPGHRPDVPFGRVETQVSSNDAGRLGALDANAAVGHNAAVHLDASARGNEDYRRPQNERVLNSQAHTRSVAVGASNFFDNGYLGAAYSDYASNYGTIAEEFTTIEMRQRRLDLAGEWRLDGFVRAVRFKNSLSSYGHEEIDEGRENTRFRNLGDEARIDVFHRPLGELNGRFGVQVGGFDFSALGNEAFVPKTSTRNVGLFWFEERTRGRWRPSAGVRTEFTTVGSKGDQHFGDGRERAFSALDGSLGLSFMMGSQNALGLNASYVERAPGYQELFARGPHAATKTFEIGDANLGKERSRAAELFWKHDATGNNGRIGVFVQDFENFVGMVATGAVDGESGSAVYAYRPLSARLSGAEAEWRWVLPFHLAGGAIEFWTHGDLVHGEDRDTGRPLPRMTPIRESAGFTYKVDRWRGDLEVQRSERQPRVAQFETETPAFVLVNLGAELALNYRVADVTAFARLNNAFNVTARNHVSLLKDVAPLPGRSLVAGLRATF